VKIFLRNLPSGFIRPTDAVENLLFREYGSMYVARGGAVVPRFIVFRDETDVSNFQNSVDRQAERIGGMSMVLQAPVMRALINAVNEAATQGLTISPRDTDSAARSYSEAVGLWASRVDPGLDHWSANGKISKADAERIRALSPYAQVAKILGLEQKGVYFSKDLSKSIIYSVAPPGTSQHLSMLAFDVTEYDNPKVRSIMEKNGWFQTVVSDLPHFTYLGVSESELPNLGLKQRVKDGRTYWVPDI
jgi:hypothetical protein